MFIDIHVHTRSIPGPLRNGKPAFATPEQLLARYAPIGVEQAVLLPCVSPECDYVPQSNQEILEVCKRHPGRFIPFCNVDPRSMTNSSDAPLGELLDFFKFLNEFQDRLLFGTDICAPDTPTPLVDFLLGLRQTGKISENVFQKVARENARRLLHLEAPAS